MMSACCRWVSGWSRQGEWLESAVCCRWVGGWSRQYAAGAWVAGVGSMLQVDEWLESAGLQQVDEWLESAVCCRCVGGWSRQYAAGG